jgi:hypothetical protein
MHTLDDLSIPAEDLIDADVAQIKDPRHHFDRQRAGHARPEINCSIGRDASDQHSSTIGGKALEGADLARPERGGEWLTMSCVL